MWKTELAFKADIKFLLFPYSSLLLCTGWINELICYLYMSIYCWCHYYVTVILINSLAECQWFLCGSLSVKLTFFVASFVSIKVAIYRKKMLVTSRKKSSPERGKKKTQNLMFVLFWNLSLKVRLHGFDKYKQKICVGMYLSCICILKL